MDDGPVGLGAVDDPHQHPTTRADIRNNMIASGDPWADDSLLDLDTCRICRGEATSTEPLFFPCKCSGSIKYVHQDCLMEWLSHSQKKHCELCKTPFRFTKLYSPDMPKHLPFHIFVHHMTRYLFRNVLVWLRAALVTSVWLGWLPYLMRSIWSFLFWISDEGFTTIALLDSRHASPAPGTDLMSITVMGTTMCPSTPLLATATTPASLGEIMTQLPVSTIMKAVTKPANISTTHTWLRMLFGLSTQSQPLNQEFPGYHNATLLHRMTKTTLSDSRRSILSDVQFLNRITRNPTVNRIIIHVLEGQIITLLAIICFILIILVRDYVVQQQPEINMRAAFAAVEDAENDMAPPAPAAQPFQPVQPAQPVEPIQPVQHVQHVQIIRPPSPPQLDLPAYTSDQEDDNQEEGQNKDQNNDDLLATGAHDEHRDRALRPTDPLPDIVRPNLRQRPMMGMGRRPILNIPDQIQTSRGSSPVSPRSPRGLLDEGQSAFLRDRSPLRMDRDGSSGQTTVGEFMRIYRAADGDNDKIREIIQQEGLDESRFSPFLHNRASSPSSMLFPQNRSSSPSSTVAEKACSDSLSSTCAGSDDENDVTNAVLDKGKGKAGDISNSQTQEPASSASLLPLASRSRASSDGPQPQVTINPLANNSWSFSNLGPDTVPQPPDSDADGFKFEYTTPEIEIGFISDSNDESTDTSIGSHASIILPPDGQPYIRSRSPSETSVTANPAGSTEETTNDMPPPPVVVDERDVGTTALHTDAEVRRAAVPPQPPNTIVGRVADFMWGDVPPADADGVHQEPVDIFGDNQNPPFMHGGHGGDDGEEGEPEDDEMAPDVVEAAVAAGIDPEAVEDAEDFDGIMELIGMRGPIAGLFQNAVFCAFLVSISIFLGIFIPYNIGRLAAWFLANPVRIFRILYSLVQVVQDLALLAVGYTSTFIFNIIEAFRLLLGSHYGKQTLRTFRLEARQLTDSVLGRFANGIFPESRVLSPNEMHNFSAVTHQALLEVKSNIRYCILLLGEALFYIFGGDYATKWSAAVELWTATSSATVPLLGDLFRTALQPSTWAIDLNPPADSPTLDVALAYWGAQDRSWAILLGYASLIFLAALYLGRGTTFSTGQAAQEWEASIIDALNQASGVMKVILIISIEMLVFPLYCGLLLDVALLPLFEHTTLKSRLLFAYNYPLTSSFVHWFIGTGYMFHFALFVSMCRKIMRKGVLCTYLVLFSSFSSMLTSHRFHSRSRRPRVPSSS